MPEIDVSGRHLAIGALFLFAVACSSPLSREDDGGVAPGVTGATHPWFPIDAGTAHELGRPMPEGPMQCDSCHVASADTFMKYTCIGCHGHEEALTARLHLVVTGYKYASEDCFGCHPTAAKQPYDHFGIIGDCALCHDVGAPFAALPKGGFTHPPMGGADCGACHGTSTWAGGGGAPAGPSRDPSVDVTVTALVPTYAGTSITRVTPLLETLPMTMSHGSTDIDAEASSSCDNCHADARSGVFYPGRLHSALANLTLKQPTACSSCHGATAAPTGFVGPPATSPARSPSSPEMKHDGVVWWNDVPTTTPVVPAECGICHVAPGAQLNASWATGKSGTGPALYHFSLADAGMAQPASCVDCHANSRPTIMLTSSNAALPANLEFDHGQGTALSDCAKCHAKSGLPPFVDWKGGLFHLSGEKSPATCLPCHAKERPTTTTGWVSTTYTDAPFDYITNANGITHGDGQDCALCHPGPGTGAWGGTQNWVDGRFVHGAGTVSGTTCIACHVTQRPAAPVACPTCPSAADFDHSRNGNGECFGCHQATVTAGTYVNYFNPSTHALPGGDWKDGQWYPGSYFTSSPTEYFTVTEISLNRSRTSGLVTGTSVTTDTLYNGMLHISSALPAALNAGPSGAPISTTCWHCHTSTGTTVTSYNGGVYHSALANYRATPGGNIVPFPQPTSQCGDCHLKAIPKNIVEKDGGTLFPMDHSAQLAQTVTIADAGVSQISQIDCSVCHKASGRWSDGRFHATISPGLPKDCVGCHYVLMADAPKSDVSSGTTYTMKHGGSAITFQTCETCHTAALSKAATTPAAATLWKTGAYHPSLTGQPGACVDCHGTSVPAASTPSSWSYTLAKGRTATNQGQWMSHGSSDVVGKDCALCHAPDAKKVGSAWSKAALFHPAVTNTKLCQGCHGLTNGGGAVIGTGNNLPAGLTDSTTVTSASASTGVSGQIDQLTHADINMAGECGRCHTQAGISSTPGIQGKEWAQAKFHINFNAASPLVMNGTTGRCSNCHMSLKPGSGYTKQDHGTFTGASGSEDCSSCHSWPGTGTAAAPNWLGATGQPQYLSVGGFSISQPPATGATTQGGIFNLPHPPSTSGLCTDCHASSGGGKQAKGYDHASALSNSNCNSCHEAGSDLVGTAWNSATVTSSGAGDTRPYTLTSVVAKYGNGLTVTYANHFFPVDCGECHVVPAGNGLVTTGTAYQKAWRFPHTTSKMTNPSTCLTCHTGGIPGAPDGGVSDPARDLTIDAGIPRYSGATITSISAQAETLAMSMNHASTEIPTAASSSCANCHDTATSGVYYPGSLHPALSTLALAQPTACASCHADAVPTGFVGPLASSPARNPASAEMKHDAVSWTNGAPTTTTLVSTNCGLCHLSPTDLGGSWAVGKAGTAPATYHPALAAASVAQPSSCIDCHANSRPSGVLTSGNSGLAAKLEYDHSTGAALGDCGSCHAKSTASPWASWSGGLFHLVGSANPTTCLPCHAQERPTSTTGWISTSYQSSPFDYGTNPSGITHGDGLDCVTCHPGPGRGTWGVDQNWVDGHFTHGATTVSATTCIACHESQRPTVSIACSSCAEDPFVHSISGTGECFGCHQATVAAKSYVDYYNPSTHTLPGGDWKGGQDYPGSVFTSSSTQFIKVNEIILNRSGANDLVTSMSSVSTTLYNGMLHVSSALPAALNAGQTNSPDFSVCWHCHTATGTTVTSYLDGKYHSALTNYRATPTSAVSAFSQPTASCGDCHAQMFPSGIVQKGASNLVPMDHSARFTSAVVIGGVSATGVPQIDCSVCHHLPGNSWADGLFHANIGAAVPADCVTCHYTLMADAAESDLTSTTQYAMRHRSGQLVFQACETCHTAALGKAKTTPALATLWQTGAYHESITTQPAACIDCHAVSEPAANASTQSSWTYALALGGTSTNGAQWMNHGASSVVGKDCVLCHAADAKKTGSAWSKAALFHTAVPNSTACQICHGLTNGGGSVAGTRNNLPSGLTNSTWVTAASSSPANTHDQLTHTDINVSAKDCNFCHTQAGLSSSSGVAGKEWAQASFHKNFTTANPLVMNGGTGRCSNCHMNLRPGTSYTEMDHSAYTATSTTDCSGCHAWPGTGTSTAPNWLGAVGAHDSTGSTAASTLDCNSCHGQAGTASKHLTVAAASHYGGITNGNRCVTCHIDFAGFKDTITNLLYPHSNSLANGGGCVTCHAFKSQIYTTLTNTPALTYPVASGGHTFSQTRSVTVAFDDESHPQAHTVSTMTRCGACHQYAKTTASLNVWTFKHRPSNPGISNSKSSSGCNVCH